MLEDKDVESLLRDEFRFAGLSERLSEFRQSADFQEVMI
jgi:hypothetical protein